MYVIKRDENGVVQGVESQLGFHPKSHLNPKWQDFLDWNAKQPAPLDLSDQPPEPPEVDVDLESIRWILEKSDDQIGPAERWTVVLKTIRRLVKKNMLQ